jgi:hypothetical protein
MMRNLKTLGLALAVAFAISVVAAPAASAQQGFITSDGPMTLIAEETGEVGSNAVTAFGFRAECPGSTGTGHKYNVTPHTLIPSGETTFTLTPHLKQANHNCRVFSGNFPTTADFNGCDYVTHIGITSGGTGTYNGTTDIVCPVGQEITFTVFTNTTDETNNKPFCVLHIKPQTGLAGVHGTDTGNGFIDLAGTIEGIHMSKTNATGIGHLVLCPNQTTTTAKMDADGTIRAVNAKGEQTPISLSD